MRGSDLESVLRRTALCGLGVAGSALLGVGTGQWTMAEASGFYTHPVDRGPPAYARERPVADDLWAHQASYTPADAGYSDADYSAGVGSTATSVHPVYRSASGS